MKIKRGDIYMCELNGIGSVQRNTRPCVVVSNNKANTFSPVITVAPITSKIKHNLPTHVMIELNVLSCVMLEQITTVDKTQLYEIMGHCTPELMDKIDVAMLIQLGMEQTTLQRENRKLRKKLLEYEKRLLENSLLTNSEVKKEKVRKIGTIR